MAGVTVTFPNYVDAKLYCLWLDGAVFVALHFDINRLHCRFDYRPPRAATLG